MQWGLRAWIHENPLYNHILSVETLWDAFNSATSFLLLEWISFLHGMAASIGLSNFLIAFLTDSLYSSWSGSMKKNLSVVEPSIVELWLLVLPLLFSRFWAIFPILLHTSGHTWSGLVLVWTLVSISWDHIYSLGGFAFNKMNFVNPFQKPDKLLFESTFQYSSVRFSCTQDHIILFLQIVTNGFCTWSNFQLLQLFVDLFQLFFVFQDGILRYSFHSKIDFDFWLFVNKWNRNPLQFPEARRTSILCHVAFDISILSSDRIQFPGAGRRTTREWLLLLLLLLRLPIAPECQLRCRSRSWESFE